MRARSRSCAAMLAAVLYAVSGRAAPAQSTKDVAGFYTLVSIDNTRPDGSVVPQYGPHPKGALSLDPSGRYILFIRRADIEKFASSNVREGTAAENRSVVRGSIAHTGTYAIDGDGKTIVLRIESSTFPNQDRTEMKRSLTLTPNELTYVVPVPSVGSGTATLVWRRVK